MNIVLISAILSTMLASVFGLGRMLRSLAQEGHTPAWMRDRTNIPYRGILVSGGAMLVALGLGLLLPQGLYLFLVSSGGFSLLFAYALIIASHYRLRKQHGGPLTQRPGMRGFPYTSWFSIGSLIVILVSMPLFLVRERFDRRNNVCCFFYKCVRTGKSISKTISNFQSA